MKKNHKYFHWLYYQKHTRLLFNVGSGIFSWLFLVVTQPFGINAVELGGYLNLIAFLAPFAALWPATFYMIDWFSCLITQINFNKNIRADLILWLLKLVLLIQVHYVIRGLLCNWQCIDIPEYLQLWLAVSLLFGFIYFPVSLYARTSIIILWLVPA